MGLAKLCSTIVSAPARIAGLLILAGLGISSAPARTETSERPAPEHPQACERLLAKSAALLGEDIATLRKDVSYDPDCHWLSFEDDYSIFRSEGLPFDTFTQPSHPNWSWRQGKLLRRQGNRWVPVHNIGDRFNLVDIHFDQNGEAWWLQHISGPIGPPRTEIWHSVQGQPRRFAALGQILLRLRLDPLGRPWIYSENEEPADFSIRELMRYEKGGQLAEAWFATASPGQAGLAELGAPVLQALGWSAQDVRYQAPVFLRDGRPIAIPEGVHTLADPLSGRIWLNAPLSPKAPWRPNRLFLIEADGRISSFPALKDVTLLHLDQKGQVWLTTGSEQPVIWKIGSDLKPSSQNYAIHDLQQPIGSVRFDASSGYLLQRIALPKRLEGRRGYLESGLRSYGMSGDYTHLSEDIYLVDRHELVSSDYQGFNTMGYDTRIHLFYNPELDLIARSRDYSDTHAYDTYSESSLYILDNDLSVLDKLTGLRYYRILNP